jgi:lysophospholipase L1-like esterase
MSFQSAASLLAGVRAGTVLVLVGFCAAVAACGSHSPTGPASGPAIMCPAAVAAESPDGAPVAVQFPPPSVSGGSPPLTTTCSPAAGSSFSTGETTVTCTAQDSAGHTATCTVPVTVTRTPTLPSTRFLAFGDSITAGEISFNATMLLVDPSQSYPTDLAGLLRARYTTQDINVVNDGVSGETAVQGNSRISGAIVRNNAQVLLLLEGVNDLQQQGEDGINEVIEALKFDIRDGVRRGCTVFISTLLPEKDGFRASAKELISPTNDKIRDLAAREGVVLVDSWQVFAGKEATLIGQDGLHPTVEGYQVLAQAFFDSIQRHLEKKLRLSLLRH